jgi:integrase/recombinase XerC
LNYKADLKEFQAFLKDIDITEVDILLVRKYLVHLKERRLSGRSISRKLSSLRSFFRFLVKENYIALNPAEAIASPKREIHD